MSLIELDSLEKTYPLGEKRTFVLRSIDLEIEGIDSDPPPLSGDVDLEGDRKVERADPAA